MKVNSCFCLPCLVALLCCTGCSSDAPAEGDGAGRGAVALNDPSKEASTSAGGSQQTVQKGATNRSANSSPIDQDAGDPGDKNVAAAFPQAANNSTENNSDPLEEDRTKYQDDPNAEPIPPAKDDQEVQPKLDNGRDRSTARPNNTHAAKPKTNEPPERIDTKTNNPPVRTTVKSATELPEKYRSLDQDKDGQLGVYEWPKDRISELKKLDRNNDGFLTPSELGGADQKVETKSDSDGDDADG